jgi:hypothetical protein
MSLSYRYAQIRRPNYNSSQHTSISAPSLCKALHVRAYFEDGTLPEANTICSVVGSAIPLPDIEDEDAQAVFESGGDLSRNREVLNAVRKISSSYSPPFRV